MLQSSKLFLLLHGLCHLFVSSWHMPSDFTQRKHVHRPDPFGNVHRATSSSNVTPSRPLPRLVLLIPAYNEEARIPSTLQSYQDFFEKSIWECEILVIDDGSKDKTASIVNSFPGKIPIQSVSLPANQGKGAALARGIKVAADQNSKEHTLILTLDADGSGELVYLETLMHSLEDLLTQQDGSVNWSHPAMVTGNRKYNLFTARGITRWGFQTCVKLIMNDLRVRDSQCGYKLMTLPAATRLYRGLHLQRWSHDVEVLFRAKLYAIPISEVLIEWNDKDGSKVVESGVVRVSTEMLLDVLRLRWEYSVTGNWKPADK
jgi:dolichyl-phosphate beta-glucosyltransferase